MQKKNFLLIVADHGRKEFYNECSVKNKIRFAWFILDFIKVQGN